MNWRNTTHVAMNLARCDLVSAMKYCPEAFHHRFIQSIRLLTEQIDDHDEFMKSQERWHKKDGWKILDLRNSKW